MGNNATIVASCKYCKSLLPSGLLIFFCPECGETITNAEHEMVKKKSQNFRRVSMKSQMFFTIMPFITFLAAYRIKKLKKFFMIYSIAIFTSLYISFLIFLPFFFFDFLYPLRALYFFFIIFFTWLISSLIMIYFIRKWSIQWNKLINFLDYLE